MKFLVVYFHALTFGSIHWIKKLCWKHCCMCFNAANGKVDYKTSLMVKIEMRGCQLNVNVQQKSFKFRWRQWLAFFQASTTITTTAARLTTTTRASNTNSLEVAEGEDRARARGLTGIQDSQTGIIAGQIIKTV